MTAEHAHAADDPPPEDPADPTEPDVVTWLRGILEQHIAAARDAELVRPGDWWVENYPRRPRYGEAQTVSVAAAKGEVAEVYFEAELASEHIALCSPKTMLALYAGQLRVLHLLTVAVRRALEHTVLLIDAVVAALSAGQLPNSPAVAAMRREAQRRDGLTTGLWLAVLALAEAHADQPGYRSQWRIDDALPDAADDQGVPLR